jgi:hypothetical protein
VEVLEDRLAPAVFNVISTADNNNPVITAGHAGTAADPFLAPSLRSAITAANATAGDNTVNLAVAGTYKITRPGTPGETDNAAGEFAIVPKAGGGNLTIQNTSGFAVTVDGNHLNRVFDINPNPGNTPKATITFTGFTITGGIAAPGDGAGGSGGGIRDQGNVSLTLNDVVVTGNSATADGGGIVMENATGSTPWTLTVNNSTITSNHAGDAGGGIDTDGKGFVNINEGTLIKGNSTVNQGGGIWLDAIAGAVDTVTVTNGGAGYTSAPTVTFVSTDGNGTGATGFATIQNGQVVGVTITNSGNGYDAPPRVVFSGGGGTGAAATATFVAFQAATLNVTGATISNNFAGGTGGGIGNAGNGAVTITDSTLSGNFTLANGGGFGDENNLGTLTVSNTLFVGNVGTTNGGGVSENGPSAVISNSTFRDNLSAAGGGVFADAGTTLRLVGDLFAENSGTTQGGGVNAVGPTTNISNSEFRDNFAGTGGGLFVGGTTFTGLNLTFVDNTSSGNGGGIELQSIGFGTNQSFLTNSTLTGNKALNNNGGLSGGGIDMSAATSGDLVLINDTLNANFADNGGGLFLAGNTHGSAIFENTIVAGNFATTAGPDVDSGTGNVVDLGGNLIGNPTGSNGFIQGGTTLFRVDPLLGPLQNNGGPTVGASGDALTLETEALLPGSPAIGKGLSTFTVGTDERGLVRPFIARTTGTDIGAFEVQGATPTVLSTVPGNGDVNPYGVAFVPASFPQGGGAGGYPPASPLAGVLQPGDLLIANFNNANNVQGTGTTITRITPAGQQSTFFTSTVLGLDDALAVLKAGFVVVGNVPNVDGMGTPGAGSLQFLDGNGNVVLTLANANLLNGPWGLAVNDQGSTVQLFVSNVLSGTVTRINLSISGGAITVTSLTQIASGYTHRLDPNAFVLGPSGLAYDSTHDVLYVASQAEDTIFKITNAGATTTDAGKGTRVVLDNAHLHGPLQLALAPNGNLIVANSDGVNADPNQPSEIVEYATTGVFVGQFPVDPANGGAFGLGFTPTAGGGVKLAAVDDNTATISIWDFEPGAVTGSVFQDHNGDGVLNGIDANLPGVTVNLINQSTGAVVASTTTDVNGHYTFANVAASTYQVSVTPPAGSVLSTSPATVTVGSTSVTATPLGLFTFASLSGTTLTISGTPRADTVTIQLGSTTDTITFDGATYTVAASAVTSIVYVGNGGADAVTVILTGTGNVAALTTTGVQVTGTGTTVSVSGVSKIVVDGGAGDRAYLADSAGSDTFVASPTSSTLSGAGFVEQANGFGVVVAVSSQGGNDTAYLYDSAGNDTFTATPTTGYLQGSGFWEQAYGFNAVVAVSTGGHDVAYLYGSPGNDTFTATPTTGYLQGSGFWEQAYGFATVIATGNGGGRDLAYLYASAGNDNFVATPTYAYLQGSGFYNQANGFLVFGISNAGGKATATLYGSPGNDNFVGNPSYSFLEGSGFFEEAIGFTTVNAAGGGGTDTATLFGAAGGGNTFTGSGNRAWLSGSGYAINLMDFASVVAEATGGGTNKRELATLDYAFSTIGDWM